MLSKLRGLVFFEKESKLLKYMKNLKFIGKENKVFGFFRTWKVDRWESNAFRLKYLAQKEKVL